MCWTLPLSTQLQLFQMVPFLGILALRPSFFYNNSLPPHPHLLLECLFSPCWEQVHSETKRTKLLVSFPVTVRLILETVIHILLPPSWVAFMAAFIASIYLFKKCHFENINLKARQPLRRNTERVHLFNEYSKLYFWACPLFQIYFSKCPPTCYPKRGRCRQWKQRKREAWSLRLALQTLSLHKWADWGLEMVKRWPSKSTHPFVLLAASNLNLLHPPGLG